MKQKLRLLILILIPFSITTLNPWPLWDLGIWTGYGQRLWHDWHFLYHDTIGILPTDNNMNPAWLPALLYSAIHKLGGFELLFYAHQAFLIFLLWLIYKKTILQNETATLAERLSVYALWFGTGSYFSPRPNLIAFLWVFLAYEILEFKELDKKSWLKLIFLQILWVNTHGSFVLLPLMAGWAILFQKRLTRSNLLGLTGLVLACFVNPWGWKMFPWVLKTREYSRWIQITEWMPVTSMENPTQFAAFWGLVIFTVVMAVKNRKILASPFIALVLISFTGLRISIFSFIALPLFLKRYTQLFEKNQNKDDGKLGPSLVVLTLLLAVNIFSQPFFKQKFSSIFPERFRDAYDSPVKIAAEIKSRGPADCPVLNEMPLGGFLMMETPNPILIDGRITPYTQVSFEIYFALLSLQETGIVTESKACFAVFSESEHPKLIEELKKSFGFTPVMSELGYVLLEKPTGVK